MADEYFVKRLDDIHFEVAKFKDDAAVPDRVYRITYDAVHQRGKCDCPAGMYRQTGIKDKHVQMVIKWLTANTSPKVIVNNKLGPR